MLHGLKKTSLALALAVIPLLGAAVPAKGPGNPSVAELLQRNATARGGAAAWNDVRTMSFDGRMDLGKPDTTTANAIAAAQPPSSVKRSLAEAGLRRHPAIPVETDEDKPDESAVQPVVLPFHMELARPHSSRLEVTFKGQTSVQVFDGTQGWKLRAYVDKNKLQPYSPEEVRAAADLDDLDGPLMNPQAKGVHVAYDREDTVDGHPCYRLTVTLKDGAIRHVWLDRSTYLEVKRDSPSKRIDGIPRVVATYYSDYRKVDGVMIPFLIETRIDGTPRGSRMIIDRAAVNQALPANRFTKPA